tara:strand:+ start:1926 stop:5147 length:3222 start_codon:yes stop_codon:yes gene_type:complete
MYASDFKFRNIIAFLLGVILCFWSASTTAQCWTSDLSEVEQVAVARETFETELFAESIEAAKCYLDEFPLGNSREEMLYLSAESFRNSGKLIDAVKGYDELMIIFPASKEYLEKVMFHKGVLQARIKKYPESINSLKMFLLKFPNSSFRDEAYYWQGYATSYHAELLRLKNKEMALPEFEASTTHFVKSNPTSLSQTQQIERLHLLGRAWWFLDDISQAADAWEKYFDYSNSISQEEALSLKFQLATGFQKKKNYAKAEKWYARITKDHPDSALATSSSFWQAEMAYAKAVQLEKTTEFDSNSVEGLVKHYQQYINRNDNEHLSLAYYRIGVLQRSHQSNQSISAFNEYILTNDTTYLNEVLYQLGYLYIEKKHHKNAINSFEKYLSKGYKTHVDEVQYQLGMLYIKTKQPLKAIAAYEQYLSGEVKEHTAMTQLSLGSLYLGAKQPFLALAAFENARQYPQYQHNIELLQTLNVLYRETASDAKYIKFLKEVAFDSKLSEKDRHEFQTQLYLKYYDQENCVKFISELGKKPGYLKYSKNSNLDEWHHFLFLRGGCYFEEQSWSEARNDLRKVRNNGKYRDQSISMLLEAHKKLEDWKSITWELQDVFERKSPRMTINHYKLWIFSSQRRNDPQRLERIKKIFERWKESFPKDQENLDRLQIYIIESRIQEFTKEENWKGLSSFIRSEIHAGRINLEEQRFNQLLFAEKKQGNWSGILSAYKLLQIHNSELYGTVGAFIDQAKAAENMGEKELSLEFYQLAIEGKPLNEEEKDKQNEIKQFLANMTFQKWIEQEEWSKVTMAIHKEVKEKKRKLNDENFKLLLFAENQKNGRAKYNGILDAYALLEKYDKQKTLTLESQIDQGYAAEKLGGYKRAKIYYSRALKKVPDENVDLVLQLVVELKRLYERTKDYKSLVNIYKRAYGALKKSSRSKKELRTYAYLIGYYQFFYLKQNKNARVWLLRSDGGGSSNQELQSAYWVAKLDQLAKKPVMALKRLKELSGRKISKKSALYVQIHFELGTLYHLSENWDFALRHYRFAAKAEASEEFKKIQTTAEENAKEISDYLKSIKAAQG